MKRAGISVTLCLAVLASAEKSYSEPKFPVLQGEYLGQKTPGLIAQVFAPGIVSIEGRYEYGIAFSPDLKEVYFSTQEEGGVASIHASRLEKGKWQPIELLSLTNGEKAGEMQPFISHDNNTMYFTAYNTDFSDTKIWQAQRSHSGWEKASKLDSPINDEEVFYSTLASNGDMYYTDIYKSNVYSSSASKGKYPKTEVVDIAFGIHSFISPSQDYILVDGLAKGKEKKDKDIFVYFKKKDNTWSEPINLGSGVNSEFYETVPSVTPDGKYLFFSRYDEPGGRISNFYWVSTDVIEKVRPKE